MISSRRNVMIIHGRCEPLTNSVRELLRAMDLNPQDWNQLKLNVGSMSPTTLDIVRQAIDKVHAVVAILHGEEEVKLIPALGSGDEGLQPRPNVIFEVGMALRIIPDRTVLLQFGSIREWSDIAGVNRFHFKDTAAKRRELMLLLGQYCDVDHTSTRYADIKLDFRCKGSNTP